MKSGAVRFLFLLLLSAAASLLTGCATDEPENTSVRPWNSPTSWQQNGALGSMDMQHH